METKEDLPLILFNGGKIPGGKELQEIFEHSMPERHYEYSSFDCHVLNPSYSVKGLSDDLENVQTKKEIKHTITILVMVSGTVQFGKDRKGPTDTFSETFVLIPNYESSGRRSGRAPRGRDFLIQCQNFRIVA